MTTDKLSRRRVPDYIARLRPYVPGKPIEEVERELGLRASKLASNENPLGPSPKALEAIQKYLAESNRYPDAGGHYLREKLAARHRVPAEQIVLGAGSTELIQLLSHIFIEPGAEGLSSEGSFVVFPMSVQAAGGEPVLAPLRHYAYDLDALAARVGERTRLLYLANPNNPTGTMFTAGETDRLLEKIPPDLPVVLDEAYCDYVERPDYSCSLDYVREGRFLMVLRTFSKAHGLAGLRIGYGVGHADIIGALNRIRSPFNVSTVAQVAALAALDDAEHIRRSVESNRRGLAYLQAELSKLGIQCVPSFANFLFVETGRPAQGDFQALLKMGIIVRPLGFMGIPNGLRITVGTEEENRRLVEALAQLAAAPAARTGRARIGQA